MNINKLHLFFYSDNIESIMHKWIQYFQFEDVRIFSKMGMQ